MMGIVKEQGNPGEDKQNKGDDKGIDEIKDETPFLSLSSALLGSRSVFFMGNKKGIKKGKTRF